MNNTLKFATLLAAAAAICAPAARALDGKVVLDQMVKKGLLTPEEADAIIKKDNEKQKENKKLAVATSKEIDTTKITVSGKAQVQFKHIVTDNRTANVKDSNRDGFEMRRLDIAVAGDIAEDWQALVDYRVESSNPTAPADAGIQIDKAWIEHDTKSFGQFLAGIKKAPFGYEEVVSSSYILPIERGIVNNYFAGNAPTVGTATNGGHNLALAERRMGIYYDSARTKDIEKNGGTKWGAAFTNAIRRRTDNAHNDFSYYLHGLHVAKLSDSTFLDFGVNSTVTDGQSQTKAVAGDNEFFGNNSYGVEVYTRLRTGDLTLFGEVYQAWAENGRRTAVANQYETAAPVGVVLMASYMINERYEPVLALNYLDTNGRGVRPEGVIRDATSTGANTAGVYDHALGMYAGMNYYITKSKSLKISAGLEATRFEGREQTIAGEGKADVYGSRVQIQALF